MILRVLVLVLALAGCKKHVQPSLPQIPDSSDLAGGSNREENGAVIFHRILRYTGNKSQAMAFYQPEMEKRGAHRQGDGFVDDNMEHTGDFGSTGWGAPRDPSRPGVWLFMVETPNDVRIDIWESVPKPP